MMTLAQVDPGTVEPWLKVFFWLVGGVFALVKLVKEFSGAKTRTEIANQPIEVKEHAGVVTRAELDKVDQQLHGRLKRERVEMEEQIRRVEAAAEKRSDKLDVKLEENTRLTSEMSGQVTQMNQELHQLTQSLTSFLRDQAKR